MRVRFWGTRGSIAKPGPSTLRYGGNTSCVEVRADDGTVVVLDCGTGAHELGRALSSGPWSSQPRHLLIGHSHWDHIQGFPFFGPLFTPGIEWRVYAPGGGRRQLEATLAGQMSYDYSPITLANLNAEVKLRDLREGLLDLGGIRVTAQYMNHPALTLGYRLEADGAVLVYATDHEPHSLHPLAAAPGTPPIHHEDRRHVRFLEGADLIIHDAQYTLDQFPDKIGWGHSPVERVVDYAVLARAKRLALFHHDPDRDDAAVDHLVAVANERAAGGDHVPVVLGAAEGQEIELQGDAHIERVPIDDDTTALLPAGPRRKHTVLLVDSDPEAVTSLERALRSEGVDVLTASDGASALGIARKSRPSLLLVDLELRLLDGLDLCRVLRSDSDPRLRDVPILVMTASDLKETDLIDAFMAGAYDYLTKPIKDTLVRSRVRGWLMRATR